jgi:hypothetical protein
VWAAVRGRLGNKDRICHFASHSGTSVLCSSAMVPMSTSIFFALTVKVMDAAFEEYLHCGDPWTGLSWS